MASSGEEARFWGARSPGAMVGRLWEGDDLAVVYDAVTGKTHFVEPAAYEILQLLTDGPLDSQMIAQRLAAAFELEMAAEDGGERDEPFDLHEYVRATLLKLSDARLVVGLSN